MPVMITHDTSIDYDLHGDGPYLILINGLGFGRWGWFKQVPTLSRHFRTITFDIRGEQNLAHGVADLSAEVVALLDHLGVQKTHVLGTSLGGFVAQELALDRPELVDRLVLVCTSYGGVGPEPMSFEALARMLGWGSMSSESAVRRGLEAATSDAYRDENPDEFDLILHWRLADSPSLSEYSQQMMAGARFNASRDVGNITSPTLVIHGAEDRYVPVANAVALAEAIPNSRLRVLDGAGHLVFIEQAEEVNKEIVAFLKPRKPRKRRTPMPPAKQTTKRLIEHAREANRKAISVLKSSKQKTHRVRKSRPRKPLQKAKEVPTLGKLKGWLQRSARIPGDWTRRLRDRLFR
jgi:pimeloyl-ACP methyl ester carboxylesterase